MKQSNKRHILARYAIVVGIMLLFSVTIIWAMFKTTVIYASAWNEKAEKVLTDSVEIPPERGKLLADNGTVLAANLRYYIPRIDWFTDGIDEKTLMKEIGGLCDSLAAFDTTMSASQWRQKILQDRRAILDAPKTVQPNGKKGRKNRAYRLFSRMLTHNEYERVRQFPFLNLRRNKNGFYAEKQNRRIKPYGDMAARSIGNVAADSTSRELHGRSGLEMALDSLLYGQPGISKNIQLTNGIVQAESQPAIKGYDITTTINIQLQDIVENELYDMCVQTGAEWGTCVLMEVATGDIKAISNLDLNKETGEYVEGVNHAVLGYEPGSVIKTISMMVALEDGIVTDINAPIQTGSVWSYAGAVVKDEHGGATRTPRQIIETSSNIGMAKLIVQKYGANPKAFHERLAEMGFFEPFHSGIAGENIPWYQNVEIKNGGRITLSRQAYGYGARIPPLCTLAMYNAIANDGKYVRPRLFKKLSREGELDSIIPVTYIRDQVCSPENARKLRTMLHDVVWGDHGTARKWVQDDRVEIAGKTGTAFDVVAGQYGQQKRLAFCGFFPFDKPKYSCIVLMKNANVGAGASSGVVLKNIARKMYAIGLLGDAPDISTIDKDKEVKDFPTLYASMNDRAFESINRHLDVNKPHRYARPPLVTKGVPNVMGLNIREAVQILEDAGLSVSFTGTGMVTSQSVAAGSAITRGQSIQLTLRNY